MSIYKQKIRIKPAVRCYNGVIRAKPFWIRKNSSAEQYHKNLGRTWIDCRNMAVPDLKTVC